jgi:hypothetical protein
MYCCLVGRWPNIFDPAIALRQLHTPLLSRQQVCIRFELLQPRPDLTSVLRVVKSVSNFLPLLILFINLISKIELALFLFEFVYVIECWPAVRVEFCPYLACDWSGGRGGPACTQWNKKGVNWNEKWKKAFRLKRRTANIGIPGAPKFVYFT